MPKMKTHKGAAKRFRRTGTGKFRRYRANKNHLMTKKNARRKRRLRQSTGVAPANQKQVRRLLPNS